MPDSPRSLPSGKPRQLKLTWQAAMIMMELGWIIAIPAVLFAFGGAMLDKKFETSPFLLLLGIAIALTASSFGVWRMIKKVQKLEESNESKESKDAKEQ